MIPFPYLSAHPTGSRYTVRPAVLTTDDDWLVLVEDLAAAEKVANESANWEPCAGVAGPKTLGIETDYSAEAGYWRFSAWRWGSVNLIVTDDKTMYLRSVAATLLAAKLNLQNKEERIALFREIKFGFTGSDSSFEAEHYTGRLP